MSKKYKWIIGILVIVSVIIAIILYSDSVKYYKISNLNIDATIKENGDMGVVQTIDYKFKGSYNGITISLPRDILSSYYDNIATINSDVIPNSLYNNSGLTNVEIYVQDNIGITKCTEVKSAKLGDSNVYTTSMDEYGYITYKVYKPSYNENRTFVIKYNLKDVVLKHTDIAELYWNFIGGRVETSISNLNINVGFESNINESDISAYTHGNITGSSTVNGSLVSVKYLTVSPYEYVGVRIVFPLVNVRNGTKHSGIAGLPLINEQETSLAQKTKLRVTLNESAIFASIILFIYWVFLLFKYERDKAIYIGPDDELKILDKYNPMIAACIAQNRDMHPRDIIAVIINLVNKGILKMDTKKVAAESDKKLYYLEINKEFFTDEENLHKLDQIEKLVINIFFEKSDKIELAEYTNNIADNPASIDKLKKLDKYVAHFLEEIGANKEKMSKLLLILNNFIFIAICLFILFVIGYNIFLNQTTMNISHNMSTYSYMIVAVFILFAVAMLPILLYLIYFFLYFILKLINIILKQTKKIIFKISSRDLVIVSCEIFIISLLVFIILIITSGSTYLLTITPLFSIGLLIIKTDNLMNKHSKEILKDYFILKSLEEKIYNGIFEEKDIESQIIWNKYLTYAIALGATDVKEYIKDFDTNENINSLLNELNIIDLYSIYSNSRDIISLKGMDSFYKSINSLSSSWIKGFSYSGGGSFSGHSGGSSFGGGGFSGGGGGGRWSWSFLKYIFIFNNNLYRS